MDNPYRIANAPHVRTWFDVNDFLPGIKDYMPVRCINKDECSDFYFMALYRDGEWEFFDDKYNDRMQVTHWCNPIKLNDIGRYKK